MTTSPWRKALCLLALFASTSLFAQDELAIIEEADTIVFFGDSITQSGEYIDHFEAALISLFPDAKFQIINRGISSETVSGTSEAGHDPPRPNAHDRFTRDVASLKPNVVIACFGMNDGNYHPFEWARFEKYQQGVRRLIERVQQETKARQLIILTPPPYDAYRRRAGDEQAKEYGYKFPALDYDETLANYSDWLMSLHSERVAVIDFHTAINDHLALRRKKQVSYHLAPDAVHPNITGHWLMAYYLLRELGLAEQLLPTFTAASKPLAAEAWEEEISLPVTSPISTDVDPLALEQEEIWRTALYGHSLVIPSEPLEQRPQRFRLLANGAPCGEFTPDELADGVNIAAVRAFPTNRVGEKLIEAVRARRRLEYYQFRLNTDKPLGGDPPAENIPAKRKDLDAEIAKLRQPVKVTIRLEPLAK